MTRKADRPRCQHVDSANRRCRKLAFGPQGRFCRRHAADIDVEPDLADALTAGLGEFTSFDPINKFLSRLLLLLVQNRISPRRAAVLAYITTQILRTIVAMQAAAAKEPVEYEYIVPWSNHEPEPKPSPQSAVAAAPATAQASS